MATEKNDQYTRVLGMKDISEINRVLGMIEGLTYGVEDPGIADGLVGAVERIDAVINKEGDDAAPAANVYPDWYYRLCDLHFEYQPQNDGGPWYRVNDVWECIEEGADGN